jgi:predicted nucleotide-binding protein
MPEHEVPSPLKEFNSLPVTPEKLTKFFEQIYRAEQLRGNAYGLDMDEDRLQVAIERIVSAVTEPHTKKIFIVHGHGEELKEAAASLVSQLQLEPVILHEQATKGLTIIEKFSVHAKEAGFAIVLLTADDLGREKSATRSPRSQPRARQNVVFEMGFFFGSLKRGRVCAIYEAGVEVPSDLGGLLCVPYDAPAGKWRKDVARELKAAGYHINLDLL